MNIAILPNFGGFGSYPLPAGLSFSEMQTSAKVQKIFFALFFTGLTALSLIIVPLSLPLAAAAISGFSYLAIRSILAALGAFYRGRPTQNLFPPEVEGALPRVGVLSDQPCSGFATKDGPESHEWKLNLIRAAQETIFLSGCYCGGKAFDEALDLMRERMRHLPNLEVSILASEIFITDENRKKMGELRNEFGERFLTAVTNEVFSYLSPVSDDASMTTQHTKALVIDYGRGYMVGGSGMVSPWSEQKGVAEPTQVEAHGMVYDQLLKIKAYRDMDFVFQSPELNGVGTRLYVEMTKLLERFRYEEPRKPKIGWPARVEPIPLPREIGRLKAACFPSGPEEGKAPFLDAMIDQVEKAKEKITIAHMYFHPPQKLLKALIDATNRGVKVTLLTNRLGDKSPGSHFSYAELSRYYAKALFEGREKGNIEYYEFGVPYTTYHKKVILVDGKTALIGSANIGEKSLNGDHYEINLLVESEEFAASIEELIEQDKKYCEIDRSPEISLKTRIWASVQSLFVPFL